MESKVMAIKPKGYHLTIEYRTAKEEGKIDVDGWILGDERKWVTPTENIQGETLEKNKENDVEPSVPLSVVQKMIDESLAKSKADAPPPRTQNAFASQPLRFEDNIDDNIPEFENWEVKDRTYYLVNGEKPISRNIQTAHNKEVALQYFHKEKAKTFSLRYTTNQNSLFIENQSKNAEDIVVSGVMFNYGKLFVPKEQTNLQKFLHIHYGNGSIYEEYDPVKISIKNLDSKKLKTKALALVENTDVLINRAIVSINNASYVEDWSEEKILEEAYNEAERNPKQYIENCNDSTIKYKGVAKSAIAKGDLIYKNNKFYTKDNAKVIDVPFDKNELDEIALYFVSNSGRTLYEYLINK